MAVRVGGFSGLSHRAARVLAEGGPQHLLLRALRKLARPLLGCRKLHIASPANLDLLCNSPKFPRTEEMLRERFRAGDICFAALDPKSDFVPGRRMR